MTAVLRGAVAAAVTPLRDGGCSTRTRSGPYVDFLAARGVDGLLALGTTGEGVLFSARAAQGDRAGLRRRRGRPAPGRRALRRADDADTVALAAHAAPTGADAVAVIAPPYFALDERGAARALRRGGGGLRAAAVLPLRVRGAQRLRDPDLGDRAAARAGVEPRRPEGLGLARGTSSRAVPARRARHLRRRRGADRRRASRPARSARSPALAAASRTRSSRSCAAVSRARGDRAGPRASRSSRLPFHAALEDRARPARRPDRRRGVRARCGA